MFTKPEILRKDIAGMGATISEACVGRLQEYCYLIVKE